MRRSKFSRPATYPFLSSPGTHSLRWRNPSPNRPNFNLPFPPPPPPSRSLPLDSLLQHLAKETATTLRPPSSNKNPTFPSLRLAATSPHREKLPPAQGTRLAGVKGGARFLQDPRLGFLSAAGKSLLRSLVEWPLVDFVTLLEARKDEIFGMDWVGLLKVVEILGNWEKALTLFEWDASTSRAEGSRLDVPAIEVMIKVSLIESTRWKSKPNNLS
ncbi:pentatricopeptide repeat-containing protein At2g18940, chloroplastic-like [Zingiber officinale]|uniref:pentatricopeptide repeat-containing protein At2g18940, chloroplastic-like n=1 Tax=Zingiber officinale TaxID=94328 RepID=UPI001C4C0C7F|nr:pentatricopeptide repeat-containing protein At2g18940, chloroplastic-like [Zingiber officinale]